MDLSITQEALPTSDEADGTLSVVASTTEVNALPEATAKSRAEKYHYAMGPSSPGRDVIKGDLLAGFEKQLRLKAVHAEQSNMEHERQNNILKFVDQAKARGTPMGPEEYNQLNNLTNPEALELIKDPSTYFEKKRAQKIIQETTTPEVARSQEDKLGLSKYLTKQYGFQNILEEANNTVEQQGVASSVVNIVEQFVPGFSWWNTTDAIKNAPTSSYLQGGNIREQVEYLMNIPDPDQAIKEAREAVLAIAENNPYDAQMFANALVQFGSSDEALLNIGTVANTLTGFTAGAVGAGVRNVQGIRAIARAAGSPGATIPGVLDASGQTIRAAWQVTSQRFRNIAEGSGARPQSFEEIAGHVPSMFNPGEVLNGAGHTPFSVEYANRLEDTLLRNSEALLARGVDVNNVTRLDPNTSAYRVAVQETQRLFNLQYPGLNNSIINIRPVRSQNNLATNTDHLVIGIARNDQEMFDSVNEANAFRDIFGLKGGTVVPHGNKFYIEVPKAIDETLPTVRSALAIDTATEATPTSLANKFLGRIRTKDDLLPRSISKETKNATFGANQLSAMSTSIIQRAFNDLPTFNSTSRQDFTNFLNMQRDYQNPFTGIRGEFSRNLLEFNNAWRSYHGRRPTEQEATAYFTYTQVSDAEYVLRNLNIYKGKSRLGFETFGFKVDGVKSKIAPNVEGKLVEFDDVFRYDDDATVVIWDGAQGGTPEVIHTARNATAADRARLRQLHSEGYRFIELSPDGSEALKRTPTVVLPRGHINYVLARNYDTAPLPLRQLPYRPGGHVVYEDSFFISQPRIESHQYRGTTINDYMGDHTAMAFRSQADANRYAHNFNVAREMLRNGDEQGLRRYLGTGHHLPFSYQRFTEMFDQARGGIFDVATPFYPRTRGGNVHSQHKLDRVYDNFREPFNNPRNSMNQDVNLQFAMERNEQLNTIQEIGTGLNPALNITPARNVDAAATLGRSVASMSRGRYLDDLKIKSSERFFQEFGDVLAGSSEELQRFPMKALFGDNINKAHPNKERVAAALNYRRAMMDLFNQRSDEQAMVGTVIENLEQALARTAVGSRRAAAITDSIPAFMAHTINDPSTFFRKVAFYPRMGFFNIKQLFLQASGVAHAAAIAGPKRAIQGSRMATLMRPLHLRGNDEILNQAARFAESDTIKRHHFIESYEALQRSGFQNVGGEYGAFDDVLDPQVFSGGMSRALDKSLVMFKAGERANRLTAWNTAYVEWRELNPLARFDGNAQKNVLQRADLFTMNMTRASNSNINQGWSSIPTQFMSYHMRLMDQMLGTRLTPRERLRAFGTYSALYGVPAGTIGTAAGALWPVHEEFRKQFEAAGMPMDNVGVQAFLNGIPQAMISLATDGEVDPTLAGTFGPSGNPFLKDFLTGRKNAAELLGGPAGATVSSVGSTAYRLVQAGYGSTLGVLELFYGGAAGRPRRTLALEEFTPLIQNISSLSNTQKAWYAYTLGKYMSKNGVETIVNDKQHPGNALFTFLLGANPQDVSDFYQKVEITKDIQELQKGHREAAIKYNRMALDTNLSDKDRIAYIEKANAEMDLADMTEDQKVSTIDASIEGYESELEKIDEKLRTGTASAYEKLFKSLEGK